jgi:transposase
MAMIPTLAEEDARRPNRERENLVGQRTRIVNRIQACLARFGIRNFKPTLRKASERLNALISPEGSQLPPNTLAEMRRDMARLRFVINQIKEIEAKGLAVRRITCSSPSISWRSSSRFRKGTSSCGCQT